MTNSKADLIMLGKSADSSGYQKYADTRTNLKRVSLVRLEAIAEPSPRSFKMKPSAHAVFTMIGVAICAMVYAEASFKFSQRERHDKEMFAWQIAHAADKEIMCSEKNSCFRIAAVPASKQHQGPTNQSVTRQQYVTNAPDGTALHSPFRPPTVVSSSMTSPLMTSGMAWNRTEQAPTAEMTTIADCMRRASDLELCGNTADAVAMYSEALERFPHCTPLRAAAIMACLRIKDYARATQLCQEGEHYATDENDRKTFDRLLQSISNA